MTTPNPAEHWPSCSDTWLVTHTPKDPDGLFRVTCGCPERHPWIPSGGSDVTLTLTRKVTTPK